MSRASKHAEKEIEEQLSELLSSFKVTDKTITEVHCSTQASGNPEGWTQEQLKALACACPGAIEKNPCCCKQNGHSCS